MVSNIFYVHPTWGNDPIWRAYFSNGLKPPTSEWLLDWLVDWLITWSIYFDWLNWSFFSDQWISGSIDWMLGYLHKLPTADGRNPANQLIGVYPDYVQGFIHPRGLAGYIPSTVPVPLIFPLKQSIRTSWPQSPFGRSDEGIGIDFRRISLRPMAIFHRRCLLAKAANANGFRWGYFLGAMDMKFTKGPLVSFKWNWWKKVW